MAVAFDAVSSTESISGTSISVTHTLGSGADRAIASGLSFSANVVNNLVVTIGGQTMAAIANADSGAAQTVRSKMHGKATSLTGAQTLSASWTETLDSIMGGVSATGVDQTTPFNNGTTANGASPTPSVTIASAVGDMTLDTAASQSNALTNPTQTERWNVIGGGAVAGGGGSSAPGAASNVHSWSVGVNQAWTEAGANFKAAAAAGAIALMPQICM